MSQYQISFRIRDYIGNKKGDCEIFPSPFAVFLNSDNVTYVEPDISIICEKDKLTDEGCNWAPDWIIDPDKQRIMVYNFEQETMEEYTFTNKVKAGIYEDFEIDFAEINIV